MTRLEAIEAAALLLTEGGIASVASVVSREAGRVRYRRNGGDVVETSEKIFFLRHRRYDVATAYDVELLEREAERFFRYDDGESYRAAARRLREIL